MRDKVYIVARSRREASAYAADTGLTRNDYRVISEAGQVRAARHGAIHLVPGWQQHPRRYAIKTALRFARIPVMDIEAEVPGSLTVQITGDSTQLDAGLAAAIEALEMISASEQPDSPVDEEAVTTTLEDLEAAGVIEAEGWEPPPALSAEQILRLAAGESGADVAPTVSSDDEQTGTTEPSEDPAPDEEPQQNRRRSRCKTCGNLHFRNEACPTEDGA